MIKTAALTLAISAQVAGYCGGTGSAIVGHWPAFSCTIYDDKCQLVVVPCSPAQLSIIHFVGGHEIPARPTVDHSERTPVRRSR